MNDEEDKNNHITLRCLNKPDCGIKFLYEKDDSTFFTHNDNGNTIQDNKGNVISCPKCDNKMLKFN